MERYCVHETLLYKWNVTLLMNVSVRMERYFTYGTLLCVLNVTLYMKRSFKWTLNPSLNVTGVRVLWVSNQEASLNKDQANEWERWEGNSRRNRRTQCLTILPKFNTLTSFVLAWWSPSVLWRISHIPSSYYLTTLYSYTNLFGLEQWKL